MRALKLTLGLRRRRRKVNIELQPVPIPDLVRSAPPGGTETAPTPEPNEIDAEGGDTNPNPNDKGGDNTCGICMERVPDSYFTNGGVGEGSKEKLVCKHMVCHPRS